ncbi:NADPH cytochrome P450 oxidoreductase family protein [Neptunicella marina]|uniref:NADPH--hemoprotein reductase n=1 Tax=Neptunicella marina TaxID=2125989 RepID=A0A8J6LVQ8_9ALTE|nr:NADPH cytochrome P450 oxidoreductase family protein [Neptunicella marina]MBC3764769.1 flavodoxin domain-containing protein [Neptunicella marina]
MISDSQRVWLVLLALAVYVFICVLSWLNHVRRNKRTQQQIISDEGVVLVAYASQTGTAEALARQSAAQLDGNTPYQLLPLNQVNEDVLANTRQALFVVSTYGEGEPPDNGAAFARHFLKGTFEQDLSHLQFSVMALGDKLYQQFCGFGHQLYQGLTELGAVALTPPLESCASDGHNPQQLISQWQILSGFHSDAPLEEPLLNTEREFVPAKLINRRWLNPGSPGAPAFFISLQTQQAFDWQAGDIAELKFPGGEIRHYSIASVAKANIIELIVRQHRFAEGGLGIGSGWLTQHADLQDQIELRIKPNPAFYAVDATVPAIFIGSGTGLAGLRAHILERAQAVGEQPLATSWLIFGERDPQKDAWLQSEMQTWQQQGLQLSLAFSRDEQNPDYVQDVMLQQQQQFLSWLEQGAVIYVCGSRKGMAHGVDAVLQQMLSQTQFEKLINQQRYRRDIY